MIKRYLYPFNLIVTPVSLFGYFIKAAIKLRDFLFK